MQKGAILNTFVMGLNIRLNEIFAKSMYINPLFSNQLLPYNKISSESK